MNAAGLSLNTVTVKGWTLAQCVDGCARHGFGGISPWRDLVAETGLAEAARLLRSSGLAVTGLCRGGMLTAEGELTPAVLEDNYRAVEEAAEIGAQCLVMVVGGLTPGSLSLERAWRLVEDGLGLVLERARDAGVPVALEPLHPMYAGDRACVNTLSHALDMCDRLGEGIGVAVDTYHVWWDRDLASQVGRARQNRLLAFHINDWLVPTRDMLLDRGMMGDGVIDIQSVADKVMAGGYRGLWEVEILSAEDWWKRDPDVVLGTIKERCEIYRAAPGPGRPRP